MSKIITRKLLRFFFDILYRVRPPKMVKYWKWGNGVMAYQTKAPDGSIRLKMEGEEHLYPGLPRGHVLLGPLAKMKHAVKNRVFNDVFAELKAMADDAKYEMVPPEKMVGSVRHIYELLSHMEQMEVVEDMKARMRLIRMVMTFFLQEDDAYRMRAQYFLEHVDKKKVALTEGDKYFARGKFWKVDFDHFSY